MLDKEDLINLSVWLFWAMAFGVLAWAAWGWVTAEGWWCHPAGLAAGYLATWVGVSGVRKAWKVE